MILRGNAETGKESSESLVLDSTVVIVVVVILSPLVLLCSGCTSHNLQSYLANMFVQFPLIRKTGFGL